MTNRTETFRDTREHEAVGAAGAPGVVVVFSEATIAGDGAYRVGRELLIGRAPERGIYLADGAMSRAHAALRKHHGQLSVDDLGSRNGTFVNGQRTSGSTAARSGDLLRCGSSLLLVVDDVVAFKGWRQPNAVDHQDQLLGGPSIARLRRELEAFSSSTLEVLLFGESGTGKELAAREIHRLSGRRGAFVAINCAAIPESLFESEIFGVARGAFTGAEQDRPGAFRRAHGGTLFLDELVELPPQQQAKLLRAVEQHQIVPVGASSPVPIDVRCVAATHGDLSVEVERGRFRADLYHRLRGAVVRLPALREHREDIPLLVDRALPPVRFVGARGTRPSFGAAAMEALLCYRWPGNVRELLRCCEEALLRAGAEGAERVALRHLRAELQPSSSTDADPLAELKRALAEHGGNVSRAAKALAMHRARVYTLLRENGLRAEDFRYSRTTGATPSARG
jgi:DNA-binding NtrC family response regulator